MPDLIPVDVALIQPQATPAATADESRQIEPVGRTLHMFDVFAETRFEAGGDDAIATMIAQEVGEYLATHAEIRVGAAIGALGFRQAQAHGAQQAQSPVFPRSGSHMPLPGSHPMTQMVSLARALDHWSIIILPHRLHAWTHD